MKKKHPQKQFFFTKQEGKGNLSKRDSSRSLELKMGVAGCSLNETLLERFPFLPPPKQHPFTNEKRRFHP